MFINEEKGVQGEELVRNAIQEAIEVIKESDSSKTAGDIKVFNNVIIEFPSLYGINGMMTTEIDHIIVGSDKVVLVETKNDNYESLDYQEPTWRLMNQQETSNPIVQNRMHKEIFCSVFGIERDNVYTIECLINYEKLNLRTHNSNDYVFGCDNMEDNFIFLLEQCFDSKNYEELKKKLTVIEAQWEQKRQIHKDNLKSAEEIEKWTKTHEGKYPFTRTDIVVCKCGNLMCFKGKKWVDYQRHNKNKTQQYLIGCTAYKNKDDKSYHDCYFYNKKFGKGFDEAKVISLRERMEWTTIEENRMTKLDRFYEQEKLMKSCILERNEIEKELNNQKRINTELSSDLKDEQTRTRQLERELNLFARLIGRIYIKKEIAHEQ